MQTCASFANPASCQTGAITGDVVASPVVLHQLPTVLIGSGRQNVASFFTKDLSIDWRGAAHAPACAAESGVGDSRGHALRLSVGAEWFESMLLGTRCVDVEPSALPALTFTVTDYDPCSNYGNWTCACHARRPRTRR